jgi:hypothetical protein
VPVDRYEPLWKMKDFCRWYGCQAWAGYQMFSRGQIPGVIRIGRNVRISPSAIREKFGARALEREPQDAA